MSFFEISTLGFTSRSRVYRRDAFRFQGLDAILSGWTAYVAQIASIACGYEEVPRVTT